MSPLSSIAIPWGWRSRGSLNIPSKKTSALSRGSTGSKVLSHLCSGGMTGLSGWDVRRYGLVRVREALLGHEGVTARVSGVPVQADAQPGAIGDLDRATLVLEHASVDDVVFRQSYPEGREQTAVYHVLRSCHKARLRAGEEAFGEVLDVDDLARRPPLRQYAEVDLCSGFSCRHGPRVAVAAPDPPSTEP